MLDQSKLRWRSTAIDAVRMLEKSDWWKSADEEALVDLRKALGKSFAAGSLDACVTRQLPVSQWPVIATQITQEKLTAQKKKAAAELEQAHKRKVELQERLALAQKDMNQASGCDALEAEGDYCAACYGSLFTEMKDGIYKFFFLVIMYIYSSGLQHIPKLIKLCPTLFAYDRFTMFILFIWT